MSGTESQIASGFAQTAASLSAVAKGFHARGWLLGTSGNLSAVVSRDPLRLAMSPSGVDKGELTAAQILLIGEQGQVLNVGAAKPSDETLLHLQIVKDRQAGAVLHTHSVWNTILSDLYATQRGISIEGYEMLKGLDRVRTHEHREWLPIIDNSQDMNSLANTIGETLARNPNAHGFLLQRHGLYSWGIDLQQAKRHIEILEFLLETLARTLEVKR
jgi:methylthioribulose-1-phosphate dehydratase